MRRKKLFAAVNPVCRQLLCFIMFLNSFIFKKPKALILLLICLCYGFCELVGAGCIFVSASDTGELFVDFVNAHSLYHAGNALQVAVAAAVESDLFYLVAVELYLDRRCACALCSVYVRHYDHSRAVLYQNKLTVVKSAHNIYQGKDKQFISPVAGQQQNKRKQKHNIFIFKNAG